MTKVPNLNIELEKIPTLSLSELKAFYSYLIGGNPQASNKSYYTLRISHKLQELRFGGLDNKTKKILENDDLDNNQKDAPLPIGAEIIKKFKGNSYKLRVVYNGYELNGKLHKSLSGAAFSITGRKVYGQAFFGI